MKDIYCLTCGEKIENRFGIVKKGHPLMSLKTTYVCEECGLIAGIPRGTEGNAATLLCTEKKFLKMYEEGKNKPLNKQEPESNQIMSDDELEWYLKDCIDTYSEYRFPDGERCLYAGHCNAVHVKNVATGTSRTGTFGRLGIGNNSAIGSSSSYTTINRQNVLERHAGTFFITDRRFILNSARYGFELSLKDVTTIDFQEDYMSIMGKGKTHIVETDDLSSIKELIMISNEYEKRILQKNADELEAVKPALETSNTLSVKEMTNDLLEYKKLLDSGIISEEEFAEIKQKYMNQVLG